MDFFVNDQLYNKFNNISCDDSCLDAMKHGQYNLI